MSVPTPSSVGRAAVQPVRDLELDGDAFRALVHEAVEQLVGFLASNADRPLDGALGIDAPALARSLRAIPPEAGTNDVRALLRDLFERVVPPSFGTTSPGFMAYVPGGGLPHAAVADLITGVVNRYVGVWRAAPGLVQLEMNMIRWLADLVGFPEGSLGTFTTGGSLAGQTALIAAREARLGHETATATIYVSDQVHHSVTKAAVQIGFRPEVIREVPSDDRLRMSIGALRRRVTEDRALGASPFLVVGSAGTTNTGAVDDLDALAGVAADEGLWLHVDATYGGFFLLTERGRGAMRGIDRADSVALDPHKGLFLPYGTGAVLVRDGPLLRRAFGGSASYMPTLQEEPDLVDFCEISPELSREGRGLRLWLPIQMHGVDAFRRALDEKLDLTLWATQALRETDGIEIVAEPQLSTVAFRLARAGSDEEELTRLNRTLLERINARQRVFLTGTTIGGRFLIRICIVSFRTHFDRVEECIQIIRQSAREMDR